MILTLYCELYGLFYGIDVATELIYVLLEFEGTKGIIYRTCTVEQKTQRNYEHGVLFYLLKGQDEVVLHPLERFCCMGDTVYSNTLHNIVA